LNQEQLQEKLTPLFQHAPLPERMGNFERTRSPQELLSVCDDVWLLVEYRHMTDETLFQVVLEGDDTTIFQVNRDGHVSPLRTSPLAEVGHILRSDLLMMLEDVEDDL
jgi:hypothetical protein